MNTTRKNALMITGAAARISQEVACIDKLIAQKGLIINQSDTVLTGFSSGSLNLLALNVCFRSENPLSWDNDYKTNMLWSLTNDKVFVKHHGLGSVFDTSPLRQTLNSFLSKAGIANFGDLPFESNVLTLSDRDLTTEWASNFGTTNQTGLIASDLFMASTAIPIAFPWQEIGDNGSNRNFPSGHFSDGGTAGQFKNFETHLGAYVLANGPFEVLHIVSPMRQEGATELNNLKEGLLKAGVKEWTAADLGKLSAMISFGGFLKFLEAVQVWQKTNGPLADQIFVSIPDMSTNFGILDFDHELDQYNAVTQWIDENPTQFAVPLDAFVAGHQAV